MFSVASKIIQVTEYSETKRDAITAPSRSNVGMISPKKKEFQSNL